LRKKLKKKLKKIKNHDKKKKVMTFL